MLAMRPVQLTRPRDWLRRRTASAKPCLRTIVPTNHQTNVPSGIHRNKQQQPKSGRDRENHFRGTAGYHPSVSQHAMQNEFAMTGSQLGLNFELRLRELG